MRSIRNVDQVWVNHNSPCGCTIPAHRLGQNARRCLPDMSCSGSLMTLREVSLLPGPCGYRIAVADEGSTAPTERTIFEKSVCMGIDEACLASMRSMIKLSAGRPTHGAVRRWT